MSKIVDAHNHIGVRHGATQTGAQLLEKMDLVGVDQAVVLPFVEGTIDNDVVRVNLVSFKKGFMRAGGLRRKNNQLLVYLDQGQFTLTGNGKPNTQRLMPGSSVFHYRDSIVSESHIDEDYRVLFVEMKK